MKIPKSFGLKTCGIYCITNTKTHKQYVGSSKNIYHRLKRHYSELQRGVHANHYLQNSYNKHGKDYFTVSILEEVPVSLLTQKEQEYIDNLKPAYNITLEVIRNTLSEESRKKISETLKTQKLLGLLKYPTHDHKKKPVTIFTTECECIGTYESERAAAKKLEELYPGLKHSQAVVNRVANLRSARAKRKRYKQHYLLRPEDECTKERSFRSDGVKIKVVDMFLNEEYVFPTIMEASRVLQCSESAVARALKKERLLLKKFKVMLHEFA